MEKAKIMDNFMCDQKLKYFLILSNLCVLFLVPCCVTGLSSSVQDIDDVVIERSAEVPPKWAHGDLVDQEEQDILLVYKLSPVNRLELGIKQAQVMGVNQAPEMYASRARLEVLNFAKKLNFPLSATLKDDLISMERKIVHDFPVSDPIPKAVYWENLRSDSIEGSYTYYTVYTLFEGQTVDAAKALQKFLDLMKSSVHQESKDLCQKIENNLNSSTINP